MTRLWVAPQRGFAKTKKQTMASRRDAEPQRKAKPEFCRTIMRKTGHANSESDLLVLSGEAGKKCGFLCASASLRENIALTA